MKTVQEVELRQCKCIFVDFFTHPELKIADASSATKVNDFTPSSITVSFPIDAESATATITLVDDVEVENLETLILELVPVPYGSTTT